MRDFNRAILVVRPKAPYAEWASNDGDAVPVDLQDIRADATAYAVPCFEDDTDLQRVIGDHWCVIFNAELNAWDADQSKWPKKRTLAMFREWFEIEPHSLVFDVGSGTSSVLGEA